MDSTTSTDVCWQGCTNPGCQVAVATKFCTVAPNICGFLVWNLSYVTLQAPRILRWFLDFWKIHAPLLIDHTLHCSDGTCV
jgi:hypothetical protein